MATGERPTMRDLLARDYDWTPRQREVLDRIVQGKGNQQIADELVISLDGAKWHMREILGKLGVDTREEAAEYWRRYNGLPSRFQRVFRGLAASSVAKVSAGVVGVAVLGAATLLALSLGGEGESGVVADETPAATSEPASTATVVVPAAATVGLIVERQSELLQEFFDDPEEARLLASEAWTVEIPRFYDPSGRFLLSGYRVTEPYTPTGGPRAVPPIGSSHATVGFASEVPGERFILYYSHRSFSGGFPEKELLHEGTGAKFYRVNDGFWLAEFGSGHAQIQSNFGVLTDDEAIAILATALER